MISDEKAADDLLNHYQQVDERFRTLSILKFFAIARGYRFEVDPDGTERMIRPDGTVAVTARFPNKATIP